MIVELAVCFGDPFVDCAVASRSFNLGNEILAMLNIDGELHGILLFGRAFFPDAEVHLLHKAFLCAQLLGLFLGMKTDGIGNLKLTTNDINSHRKLLPGLGQIWICPDNSFILGELLARTNPGHQTARLDANA